MSQKTIMIRSLFTGWHPIDKELAKAHAKWKLHAITTKTGEEALKLVNARLRGIQFTLDELK